MRTIPRDTITTWELCERTFLDKYYPSSKIDEMRKLITNFGQGQIKSFADAWERVLKLLLACPHHGIERPLTIHFFHDGWNYLSKMLLHCAAGGSFMYKPLNEALTIIE